MTPADAASMCDAQVERLDEAGPERSSFGLERRAEQRLGVAAAMMSSPEPRPAIRFDRIDQIQPTPLAPVVHDYIFGDTVTGLIGTSGRASRLSRATGRAVSGRIRRGSGRVSHRERCFTGGKRVGRGKRVWVRWELGGDGVI